MTHNDGERWLATPSEVVTALILKHREDDDVLRRFYSKVDFGFSVDDCHIWIGALSDQGYGDFRLPGRTVRAHRFAYITVMGEPPEDKPFLDHVDCLGRFCVNYRHLEPVDNTENTLRGRGIGASQQRFMRHAELAMRDARRVEGDEYEL